MTEVEIVKEPPAPDAIVTDSKAIVIDEPESDTPEEKQEPEKKPDEKEVEEAEDTEEAAASEDADEEPVKPKKRTSAKQRIDELTAARRSAERVAELERARADKFAEALAAKSPQAQVQPQTAPKQDDFENYDEFLVAKAKHEVRQEVRAEFEAERKRETEARQNARGREVARTFSTRAAAAREKFTDYDDVVNSSEVAVTDTMMQAIMLSEKGPDVAYYLASNPETVTRIASLAPIDQARELGILEANLDPPKKTTTAPKPVKTLSKGNTGPSNSLEDCSYAEYVKRRQKG